YTVPINERSKALLLTDWFVKIPGLKAEGLSISISDSIKREGSWAAGIRLKAKKKLDHIDYYFFEGSGEIPSLYWQGEPLLKTSINNIDAFTADSQEASLDFKKLNDLGKFPFMSIILTNLYPEYRDEHILIASPHIKTNELEKKLIALQLHRLFAGDTSAWIIDALTAGVLDAKPESAKAAKAL